MNSNDSTVIIYILDSLPMDFFIQNLLLFSIVSMNVTEVRYNVHTHWLIYQDFRFTTKNKNHRERITQETDLQTNCKQFLGGLMTPHKLINGSHRKPAICNHNQNISTSHTYRTRYPGFTRLCLHTCCTTSTTPVEPGTFIYASNSVPQDKGFLSNYRTLVSKNNLILFLQVILKGRRNNLGFCGHQGCYR